jgi:hypothetical protein
MLRRVEFKAALIDCFYMWLHINKIFYFVENCEGLDPGLSNSFDFYNLQDGIHKVISQLEMSGPIYCTMLVQLKGTISYD